MSSLWSRLPLPEQHVVGLLVGLALDRMSSARLPGWARPIGLPLVAAGVLVNAVAVRSRGPDPLERPSTLVRSGAYAWSRNPMYLGWSTIHLGIALISRSPGMTITWPLSVLLVHRGIRQEERQLAAGVGETFNDYAGSVPRYLGPSSVRTLIRSVRARARTRPPRSGTTRRA
jgi:protein-S-isoprenylcysteine O-methyltransferase Ste14